MKTLIRTMDPQQGLDSFIAGNSTPDSRRYTKAEIVASIPPDDNHENPYELKYYLPITPLGSHTLAAEFIVTIHSSKDATDRLALWKKTGDDSYLRLFLQHAGTDASFLEPDLVLVQGAGKESEQGPLRDLSISRFAHRTYLGRRRGR